MEDSTFHPDRGAPTASSYADARSVVVRHKNWRFALGDALQEVLQGKDNGPDLLIVFASSAYASDYEEMVREAYHTSGTGCLVGCSARGVIAGEDSRETEPGISLLALWLPDSEIRPVRLHQANQDVLADPELWFEVHNIHPADVRGWMIFAEPYRMDAQETLMHLRQHYPGTPMVGALTSTLETDRRMWVFLDDYVYDEGGVAIALGGPYDLNVLVAQGGEPVGEPWTITGVDGNRITTISNRPALEVLQETMASLDRADDDDPPMLIGFPMNEYQDEFTRGDFVVRGMIGVDVTTGSLLVGSIPRVGQTVQFHVRNPHTAHEDQKRLLAEYSTRLSRNETIAGLLCTCRGRGAAMFGSEDHDAVLARTFFPDLPIAGMFSLSEIGPVRGVPALNGFAMSFGVISRRA